MNILYCKVATCTEAFVDYFVRKVFCSYKEIGLWELDGGDSQLDTLIHSPGQPEFV